MKTNAKFKKKLAAALALTISAFVVKAVDGLQIQVHEGTNVMLRWPSTPGQTSVIVQATNLNDPIFWNVLESGYAAAENTNETTFIHYDKIPRLRGEATARPEAVAIVWLILKRGKDRW
mgnify:CR=1 FL=1